MYERAGLHFLEIKDVCVEDAGSYTCLLTNSAGTATATVALNIQGEPANQSPGFVFITSCDNVNEVVLISCFSSQVFLMTRPGESLTHSFVMLASN